MGLPDRKSVPGDEEWWAHFTEYADRAFENSTGCKRVHPKIANWLQNVLETPPILDPLEVQRVIQRWEVIKDSLRSAANASSDDLILRAFRRDKVLLLHGREIKGGLNFEEDSTEIEQAMVCLTMEIEKVTIENIKTGLETEHFGTLAEDLCGEGYARHPIGVMIVGWAFQESLAQGDFDDL